MDYIRRLLIFILIFSTCDFLYAQSKSDAVLFNSLVQRYTKSIDQADTLSGSSLWAHTGEVTFIHPGGHEYGWEGVKKIYAFFSDNFSERKLTSHNLKASVYGNVAWCEFYWNFAGVLKQDNSKVQTSGLETQIWRRIKNEWRLVHVHYSDMPSK